MSSLDPEERRDLLELIAGLREGGDGRACRLTSCRTSSASATGVANPRPGTTGDLRSAGRAASRPAHAPIPYRLKSPRRGRDGLGSPRSSTGFGRRHGRPRSPSSAGLGRLGHSSRTRTRRLEGEVLPLGIAGGRVLESFERARPTLEDAFLELVGRAAADELDARGFVRPREFLRPMTASAVLCTNKSSSNSGGRRGCRSSRPCSCFLVLSSPLLARFTLVITLQLAGGDQFQIVFLTPDQPCGGC